MVLCEISPCCPPSGRTFSRACSSIIGSIVVCSTCSSSFGVGHFDGNFVVTGKASYSIFEFDVKSDVMLFVGNNN
jgi:hypothetical protein